MGNVSNTRREQQKRANAAALEALREQGDALTEVRTIDHWASFPNAAARARFIENCLVVGMKLRGTRDPEHPNEGYSVHIFHQDVPDEDCLNLVTALLIGLAAEASGEYEGWEAPLVQPSA